jgi:glycosyltransferase involved in cell wall biosynthesis
VTRAPVAVVTTYYRPVLGGAEAAAERLAVFLTRRGHRVLVLTKWATTADARRETVDGVAIERLAPVGERNAVGKWRVIPSVFRALLRHRDEVSVVCCVDYRGIGLAALAARRFTKAPVVFQAQTEGVLSGRRIRTWVQHVGANPDGLVARLLTWPIRALYGRADAIGCISRAIEREALAEGVPRARVHYLPNPINTRVFSPASDVERRALRERLGLRADQVVGVFVGRLSREKGVMELVRARARARPMAVLIVIGPPMTDHPWDVSHHAESFVRHEGLAEQIRFIGGQPTNVVADWLRAADFAIQPSHFEAMGLAAAEAMASGLPVVVTDTTGFRDFVTNGVTGLVVPIGDVEALAVAIAKISGDVDLRVRMGRAARQRATAFEETIVLEEFGQLIDRLAASHP